MNVCSVDKLYASSLSDTRAWILDAIGCCIDQSSGSTQCRSGFLFKTEIGSSQIKSQLRRHFVNLLGTGSAYIKNKALPW